MSELHEYRVSYPAFERPLRPGTAPSNRRGPSPRVERVLTRDAIIRSEDRARKVPSQDGGWADDTAAEEMKTALKTETWEALRRESEEKADMLCELHATLSGELAVPGFSSTRRPIGKISAKCCLFSAVSALIFARKYAFCSIFQNLPDYLAENFEIW